MRFSDIPGNEDIKDRLRLLADRDKIPHAILLEGPQGVGKHALARAFIQYVSCSNRHDGDSCGVCASCRQHEIMQHIDTVYSFPYVKKKNSPTLSADYLKEFIEYVHENPFMDNVAWLEKLGLPNTQPVMYVEEANEIIRRLSYTSHSAKYKAVIIWQVDRLNEAAANKLLKVIEEPPGEAIIVMTSDAPMNILPTIYSRAQRVRVRRLEDDVVAQWMADTLGTEPDKAAGLAPLAEGSLTQAILLDKGSRDNERFLDYFISLMRLAYMRDIAALKDWSQKLATEKRDIIVNFLEYMSRLVRENFVANLNNASLNLMMPAEMEFSLKFSRFINERNVSALFDTVNKAVADIRGNVNPKVVLFDLAVTVILLLKQ